MYGRVSAETLNALRLLDSFAVATFDIPLRNESFSAPYLCCRFPKLPPMCGYATTRCTLAWRILRGSTDSTFAIRRSAAV
jgi:hypothetical protein